jgi:hypothetical protein
MSCTAETLGKAAPSLEAEVKTRLGGFLGGIVRSYLPQIWVFRTEQDAATLAVDANGHVTVTPTAAPSPDVTIELRHGELASILASKGKAAPAGPVKATPHTPKGRTAFDYLRSRFGL